MHVIFWVWHQNRSGILQVSTKSDYTELRNLIWALFPNSTQSIAYVPIFAMTELKISRYLLTHTNVEKNVRQKKISFLRKVELKIDKSDVESRVVS